MTPQEMQLIELINAKRRSQGEPEPVVDSMAPRRLGKPGQTREEIIGGLKEHQGLVDSMKNAPTDPGLAALRQQELAPPQQLSPPPGGYPGLGTAINSRYQSEMGYPAPYEADMPGAKGPLPSGNPDLHDGLLGAQGNEPGVEAPAAAEDPKAKFLQAVSAQRAGKLQERGNLQLLQDADENIQIAPNLIDVASWGRPSQMIQYGGSAPPSKTRQNQINRLDKELSPKVDPGSDESKSARSLSKASGLEVPDDVTADSLESGSGSINRRESLNLKREQMEGIQGRFDTGYDRRQKAAGAGSVDKFNSDPIVKGHREAMAGVSRARAALKVGSQVGDVAAVVATARASGEKGPLSDQDVSRWQQRQDLLGKLESTITRLGTGRLTAEHAKEIGGVLDAYDANAKQAIEAEARQRAKQHAGDYDMDEETLYGKYTGGKTAAASAAAPAPGEKIRFRDKKTGRTGRADPEDFDEATMERL
jgi:hypothetical protein